MESMRLFVTSWLSWDDDQRSRALEVIRGWPQAWQDFATREIRRLTAVEAYPTPGDLAAALDPTVVNTPALRLIDSALVEFDTPGGRKRRIITMAPQEGKALALDTPIATPSGWTTMGELSVGDEVFGRDGRPCRVTWVSPTWTGRPCFVVRTGDGEAITADAVHDWPARLRRNRGERLVSSELLAKPRLKNAHIDGTPGLDLPDADLPLDPYVLGAWLGDGNSRGAMLTSADYEIVERIRAAGVPCRKMPSGAYAWSLAPERGAGGPASPIRRVLVGLGVWGDKHVPDAYHRGSRAQRLALLQGLVDTDGYVDPRGQVEFCSTTERLANDVRELVFSLGAKASLCVGRATVNGKDCGPKYRVRFFMAGAAHLSRKAGRCVDSSVARVRYTWAEPTDSVPTRCIEVDSSDHTYLAGRSLLPTHNSERCSKWFVLWWLIRHPDARIVIASYAHGLARRWGKAVRDLIDANPQLGLRVRGDASAAAEWTLEGHRGGVVTVGVGSGLTGRPADVMVIDDPLAGQKEADSETYRENAKTWLRTTVFPRLGPGAPMLVVQTRWHEDDPAGWLVSEFPGVWTVLNIVALADHDPEAGDVDPLGREPGEWLESSRGRDTANWEQRRLEVGSRGFQALLQGRPSAPEGTVFKRDWWVRTPVRPVQLGDGTWSGLCDVEIISVDAAFKDTDGSDFVSMQVWGKRGARARLLDRVYARMDFVETVASLRRLCLKWPNARLKLIEEKANGAAVISFLRKEIPGMVPITPVDSKLSRAYGVTPFCEAGNVEIWDAPWAQDWVEQMAVFPNGAHDDDVDATTQALDRLLGAAGGGLQGFMNQLQAERGRTGPGPAERVLPHLPPTRAGV